MRIPIPKNRIVAFTLAGALLTTIVAGGLAFPAFGFIDGQDGGASAPDGTPSQQVAADAPTPNQNFTPAVQKEYGEYDDEEHDHDEEEHEEHDDEEYDEEHDDDEEHDAEADEKRGSASS